MRYRTSFFACLFCAWLSPLSAWAQTAAIDVLAYRAEVAPDPENGTVRGEVEIRFEVDANPPSRLRFDRGALEIDAVLEGNRALTFTTSPRVVDITPARPLRSGETRTLRIRYRGAPQYGLEFDPARREAFTIFSTSQWLVCVDAPSERATLDLTLIAPRGMTVVANGRPVSQRSRDAGTIAHRWRLNRPTASFLYGFAIGPYRTVEKNEARPHLRFLSIEQSPEALERIFADTRDMLAFYEDRAGVRYANADYTQVLVTDTIGQELAGLSFVSEAYGKSILDDPDAIGLLAHEAAHQWWGDLVTCRDWGHFWLNEGFATFMTAAYIEHRQGRAAYDRMVDGWRDRVQRLRDDGRDRALVYTVWEKPTRDDRAVVYQKGAYVLHRLREFLGDAAFWKGIRDYTRANAGRAVTTADFRKAMERSSGRDLGAFFEEWVDSPRN